MKVGGGGEALIEGTKPPSSRQSGAAVLARMARLRAGQRPASLSTGGRRLKAESGWGGLRGEQGV